MMSQPFSTASEALQTNKANGARTAFWERLGILYVRIALGSVCMRLRYRQAIYRDPYFLSGIVSGVSLESTTKTANRLAGSLSLAFSLIL